MWDQQGREGQGRSPTVESFPSGALPPALRAPAPLQGRVEPGKPSLPDGHGGAKAGGTISNWTDDEQPNDRDQSQAEEDQKEEDHSDGKFELAHACAFQLSSMRE